MRTCTLGTLQMSLSAKRFREQPEGKWLCTEPRPNSRDGHAQWPVDWECHVPLVVGRPGVKLACWPGLRLLDASRATSDVTAHRDWRRPGVSVASVHGVVGPNTRSDQLGMSGTLAQLCS